MKLLFVQLTLVVSVLAAGEDQVDSDLQSRGPYEFQFRVDDPDTFNNYEIQEAGDPNIVTGSYRINLPDGRTQVVSYEVHPDRGYEAKITYEGDARYPDSPNYVASPYGPPEPLRPGADKFKRESLLAEVGGEGQRRKARKVEISFKNSAPNKIEKKKKKAAPENKSVDDDLSTFSTKVALNEDSIKELDKKTQPKKKQKPQKKLKKEEKISDDGFYDSHDTPQAEPLSLQNNHQKNKAKKKETRQEYKTSEVVELTTPPPQEVKLSGNIFVPLVFEAVPTKSLDLASVNKDEELEDELEEELEEEELEEEDVLTEKSFDDIADVIYFTNDEPTGWPLLELISPPPPAAQIIEKNHQKRKIESKDLDQQGNANVQPVETKLRDFLSLPLLPLPTIYRSEFSPPASRDNDNSLAVPASLRNNIMRDHNQLVGFIGTDQYQQFYQTLFDEKLRSPPPTSTSTRRSKNKKVMKIKVKKPEEGRAPWRILDR